MAGGLRFSGPRANIVPGEALAAKVCGMWLGPRTPDSGDFPGTRNHLRRARRFSGPSSDAATRGSAHMGPGMPAGCAGFPAPRESGPGCWAPDG
ncbi:hypothetical protein BDZ91DRAFT_708239 [Kalaharituber pfeilii]|nr:hypothetical protein BDZ91DRAFT_708239 [Kalaharituber pfeilii]